MRNNKNGREKKRDNLETENGDNVRRCANSM